MTSNNSSPPLPSHKTPWYMFFIFAGCGGVMMAFFGNTASEVLARLFLAALAFIAAAVAYAVSKRKDK